ncbi:MAG TPA: endolytic transglycosylase MltG [Candidatus Paceibacterota bacterium]
MRSPFIILGLIFLALVFVFAPPLNFPEGALVNIEDGSGLEEIAQNLEEEGLIRSPFWFRASAILFGGERAMKAGEYYFEEKESAPEIAWRIWRGRYGVEVRRVTVHEGLTVKEISNIFGEDFPNFNNEAFEKKAREGYLFPDTYFFPITVNEDRVIKLMRDNFVRKIFTVLPQVEEEGLDLDEVIIMASILEAEVATRQDKEIASGILWKRLKLGMLLQVDSHMWTYEFKGLPEEPINNPGLISIEAAIHPTSTPYLYFLTGNDAKTYYAKNYDEHKKNIDKYIR